jgi:hypothetical protein
MKVVNEYIIEIGKGRKGGHEGMLVAFLETGMSNRNSL